tara:strand:+ start:1153 stop:1503 length:351 start_codon:yes stop_codon:yes gene_type:complete
MLQVDKVDELCELVERSIDLAMTGKFLFKLYPHMLAQKFTRKECTAFIDSSTASNLSFTCYDLEKFITKPDKTLKEAYGYLSKPQARKVHKYLYSMLEDAWKYEKDRRPGRKKKTK